MSFIITGLPRSRTAWFAALFNALGHPCTHEITKTCTSYEDLQLKLRTSATSDSGMALLSSLPSYPTVIIHRLPSEVVASLPIDETKVIYDLDAKLDGIPGYHVLYSNIDAELDAIISYCIGQGYDRSVVELFKTLNIQRTNHDYEITDWALSLVEEL